MQQRCPHKQSPQLRQCEVTRVPQWDVIKEGNGHAATNAPANGNNKPMAKLVSQHPGGKVEQNVAKKDQRKQVQPLRLGEVKLIHKKSGHNSQKGIFG